MIYSILFIYLFILNWLFVVKRKKDFGFGSGSGSKFSCEKFSFGSGRVRRSRVRAGFGLQFKACADLYSTVALNGQTALQSAFRHYVKH